MAIPEIELEKKNLKALRLKSLKELEKEYSKEIVSIFKEREEHKKNKSEYIKAIETYKEKIQEIEDLTKRKAEILEQVAKNKENTKMNDMLMEKFLEEIERKKKAFDVFMNEKGKEALCYIQKSKHLKEKLQEELHRFAKKREVKNESIAKAKTIVQKYNETLQKKEQDELNDIQNQPKLNILYKNYTPFHNEKNQIDYSTTRFHNIVVIKHEDELGNNPIYVSAFAKAGEETEKTDLRKKSKEITLKKFDNKTKLNSKEIIRREKAKANLERLNEELNKLNQMRKINLGKNQMVNPASNLSNAKQMEKKSENLMERLLRDKKSQRRGIFNKNNIEIKLEKEVATADSAEIEEFYKNNEEKQEVEEDDYLTRAMKEHNDMIASKNNMIKFEYEEPISREPQYFPKNLEVIPRKNPVDIESYKVQEDTHSIVHVHKDPIIRAAAAVQCSHKNFKVTDVLNLNKGSILNGKNSSNESSQKASSLVMEFFSQVNASEKKLSDRNAMQKNKEAMISGGMNECVRGKVQEEKEVNVMKEKEEEMKEDGFQRDEAKWKYSKNELYERRKKLLKDKSNLSKK